jgi:hypothetical protein
MSFGVDYAWGRPGASALKNLGAEFAGRYLSHDTTGKNLSRAEADELAAAGIRVFVVWEDAADRALAGRTAGIADALEASLQAQACGMPGDRPIYFAVDFDAAPSQMADIMAYLDGAASVLGRHRVGVYGSYAVVQTALDGGHCAWAWQTYAWSAGRWDTRAQVRQYSNDHPINGVSCDYNDAGPDFGQWMPGISPATQEDDMPFGQLRDGEGAVTPISLPAGRYKAIGFIADNGLQGLPPVEIRVAARHTDGSGWSVTELTVDGTAKGKAGWLWPNPATVDALSVRRVKGDATVAWDVS